MKISTQRKSLLVFVNRKLITYDHILPFLFELKKYNSNAKLEIWFPDFVTYKEIKKNIFLYESGKNIADLYIIKNTHYTGLLRIFNNVNVSLKLIYITLRAILFNTTFIHFKLLDHKPFSLLKYFNKSNTFLAESDSFGFTQLMNDVDYLKKTPLVANIKNTNFLQFSNCWIQKDNKKGNFLNFGTPKKRTVWINHVLNVSERYIKNQYKEYKIENPSNVVSIMLGYFGDLVYLTSKDALEKLFIETLEVLRDYKFDGIILIKPHIITDIKIVNKVIKLYPELKIYITYLHPMILATKSQVVITNNYSSTLNDFKLMGVKTIEYASYNSQALELMSGKSLRPEYVDYFINHDKLLLAKTLKKLLKEKKKKKIQIDIKDKNNNAIFDRMLNIR
jgi:hypothetical protein